MRAIFALGAFALVGCLSLSAAQAACSGGNGRGWGSGKGDGKFEMTAADKSCAISFPNVINDKKKTSVPATEMKLTRGPKNGTLNKTATGLVYTPAPGFKGKDKFCTRNTAPGIKGVTLSGCITVTVN